MIKLTEAEAEELIRKARSVEEFLSSIIRNQRVEEWELKKK